MSCSLLCLAHAASSRKKMIYLHLFPAHTFPNGAANLPNPGTHYKSSWPHQPVAKPIRLPAEPITGIARIPNPCRHNIRLINGQPVTHRERKYYSYIETGAYYPLIRIITQ